MVALKDSARQSFSRRLVEALQDMGLHTEAAQKAWLRAKFAISTEAARKWVQGLGMPTQARWGELAKALNVHPAWLRDGVGPKVLESVTHGRRPTGAVLSASQSVSDQRAKLSALGRLLDHVVDWSFGDIPADRAEAVIENARAVIDQLGPKGILDGSELDRAARMVVSRTNTG